MLSLSQLRLNVALCAALLVPLALTGCVSADFDSWNIKAEPTGSVSIIEIKTSYQHMTTAGVNYDQAVEKTMHDNISDALTQYFSTKGYQTSLATDVNADALAKAKDWIALGDQASSNMVQRWSNAYGGAVLTSAVKKRPSRNVYITDASAKLAPNARYGVYVSAHTLSRSAGIYAQTAARTLAAIATFTTSEMVMGAAGANKQHEGAKNPFFKITVVDHQTGQLLYVSSYGQLSDYSSPKKTYKDVARLLNKIFAK